MYVVSYSNKQNLGVKKRSLPRQITLGPTALKFIAVVIFAALGIIYLTTSTSGANNSIENRKLDTDQQKLQEQIDRLNTESARLKSMSNLSGETASQLTPGGSVNYLPK